jgi:hypothetical protein
MQQTIALVTKAGSITDSSDLFVDLTSAWRELGTRWPGHEGLEQVALTQLDHFPKHGFGGYVWPYLIGYVTGNRGTINELVISTKGEASTTTRGSAMQKLAEQWPDETTRALLTERAVRDQDWSPRSTALLKLAEQWPDETTRALLTERAVQDQDAYARSTALRELAEKWPDETTRALFTRRAVEDEDEAPRSAALRVLAAKWPDARTLDLFQQRASFDGFAASEVGKAHSRFGGLVFTRDVDGDGPYLDPAEPVTFEQIERAAEAANIPAASIEETVRSLSAHLGWDLTKGSAA